MLLLNTYLIKFLILSFLGSDLVSPGLFSGDKDNESVSIVYQISESSILEVNGKTNVNSFCCTSKENHSKKSLMYKYSSDEAVIIFENAKLSLETEQLDCGRKVINNDMRKALQADKYPHIVLQLKEIQNSACNNLSVCNSWVELIALADITITCNTKSYAFPVVINKMNDNYYRITGQTSLQLCDFDIEAPKAMLGLIKVNDELDIGFDLFVELS